MIAVVVDTNILTQSPKLTRSEWVSLGENRGSWGITRVIPEIVVMEATKVIPKTWAKEQEVLKKAKVGTFGLQDDLNAMVLRIQDQIDGYEAHLTNRISEVGAQVVPIPDVSHSEIAFRASRAVAPYHAGDKDGYRDTLIWFTVLDVATAMPDHEVWFVSDNTNDFGEPSVKRKQEEKEDATQLPKELHPDLRKDLEGMGLQDRVKYATSLQALEQHIAALHGPIAAEDLRELIAAVNLKDLRTLLVEQPSIVVAAEDAALSPRFAYGVVNKILPQDQAWGFSDAAYRGGDRWTANYSVDVDAGLLAFTPDGSQLPSALEKTLRLSGTVAFTKQGVPQTLEVYRVEALPDDPDQGLWNLMQGAGFAPSDFGVSADMAIFRSVQDAIGIANGWKPSGEQLEAFRRAADVAAWKPSGEQLEAFRRAADVAAWKPSGEQLRTFQRAVNMAGGFVLSDDAAQAIDNAVGNINKSLADDKPTGERPSPDEDDTKGNS